MSDTYIIIGALLVFGVLVGLVAYLYREKAIVSGRSEIRIGPIRISLEGQAREGTGQRGEERPAAVPGVRENIVIDESEIDTMEGVEVSENIVAEQSSITVRERKNRD